MFLLGVCISTVVVATRFGTPKKKIIVESRDVAFFEDGLPSPALHSSPTSGNDDDEAAIQQPLEPSHGPTPADVKKPHEPLQLSGAAAAEDDDAGFRADTKTTATSHCETPRTLH